MSEWRRAIRRLVSTSGALTAIPIVVGAFLMFRYRWEHDIRVPFDIQEFGLVLTLAAGIAMLVAGSLVGLLLLVGALLLGPFAERATGSGTFRGRCGALPNSAWWAAGVVFLSGLCLLLAITDHLDRTMRVGLAICPPILCALAARRVVEARRRRVLWWSLECASLLIASGVIVVVVLLIDGVTSAPTGTSSIVDLSILTGILVVAMLIALGTQLPADRPAAEHPFGLDGASRRALLPVTMLGFLLLTGMRDVPAATALRLTGTGDGRPVSLTIAGAIECTTLSHRAVRSVAIDGGCIIDGVRIVWRLGGHVVFRTPVVAGAGIGDRGPYRTGGTQQAVREDAVRGS